MRLTVSSLTRSRIFSSFFFFPQIEWMQQLVPFCLLAIYNSVLTCTKVTKYALQICIWIFRYYRISNMGGENIFLYLQIVQEHYISNHSPLLNYHGPQFNSIQRICLMLIISSFTGINWSYWLQLGNLRHSGSIEVPFRTGTCA